MKNSSILKKDELSSSFFLRCPFCNYEWSRNNYSVDNIYKCPKCKKYFNTKNIKIDTRPSTSELDKIDDESFSVFWKKNEKSIGIVALVIILPLGSVLYNETCTGIFILCGIIFIIEILFFIYSHRNIKILSVLFMIFTLLLTVLSLGENKLINEKNTQNQNVEQVSSYSNSQNDSNSLLDSLRKDNPSQYGILNRPLVFSDNGYDWNDKSTDEMRFAICKSFHEDFPIFSAQQYYNIVTNFYSENSDTTLRYKIGEVLAIAAKSAYQKK